MKLIFAGSTKVLTRSRFKIGTQKSDKYDKYVLLDASAFNVTPRHYTNIVDKSEGGGWNTAQVIDGYATQNMFFEASGLRSTTTFWIDSIRQNKSLESGIFEFFRNKDAYWYSVPRSKMDTTASSSLRFSSY